MILTPEQAAEILQVRPKTARALAARGAVPAFKVGKCWRFDETVLREWIAERARENIKTCRSLNVPIPSIGRSASNSLGERLDALLESLTEPPQKSSRNNFVVLSGGK